MFFDSHRLNLFIWIILFLFFVNILNIWTQHANWICIRVLNIHNDVWALNRALLAIFIWFQPFHQSFRMLDVREIFIIYLINSIVNDFFILFCFLFIILNILIILFILFVIFIWIFDVFFLWIVSIFLFRIFSSNFRIFYLFSRFFTYSWI